MWWHDGENCTPVSATTISVMLADVAKPLLERRVVLKVVGHKGKAVAVLIENVAPAAHNDHQAVQLELAAKPDKSLEHVRPRRGIRAGPPV